MLDIVYWSGTFAFFKDRLNSSVSDGEIDRAVSWSNFVRDYLFFLRASHVSSEPLVRDLHFNVALLQLSHLTVACQNVPSTASN